ncbi:MAG: hypothetical protein JWO11_1621 [Nocardioides sp.]|nr:hypothetical protein [Nocardioides sp.]
MTDETVPSTGYAPGAPARLRRVRRLVRPARPVWETAFRDPVLDSHLQLRGLTFVERHAARVGLVTVALLLGSLLFAEVWRSGELVPIGEDERLAFLPRALLPATLVTLLIAWTLILWGALTASPVFRVVAAVAFMMTNAFLISPSSFEIGDQRALAWGPDLVHVGYYLSPGVLLLSIAVARLPRVHRWLLPVWRTLVFAGAGLFFLGQLWIYEAYVEEGFPSSIQVLVDGAVQETDGLLNPLIYVAAVLVIDFSLDVTEGAAVAARDASRRVARWLLVALLAVKLWIVLVRHRDDWTTYVQERPWAAVHTVVMVVVLAVTVRLVARFGMTRAFDTVKERLLYGGALVLSLITIGQVVVVSLGVFFVVELGADEIPGFVDGYPVFGLLNWGQPIAAGLALVLGLWLLRRGAEHGRTRRPTARELGSGLVVMGVWLVPEFILNASEWNPGFSFELVDILVTVAAAAILAVRWRRIETSAAATLAAITIFAWLALSRGDWIAFLGGLFGLPAIVVVVFGIGYSIAGDSGFTRSSSRRLPQGSRVLMFVGYLVLSVTILHWLEVTHAVSLADGYAFGGFYYLGIPWAAWLLGRRLIDLDDRIGGVEAEEDADEATAAAAATG